MNRLVDAARRAFAYCLSIGVVDHQDSENNSNGDDEDEDENDGGRNNEDAENVRPEVDVNGDEIEYRYISQELYVHRLIYLCVYGFMFLMVLMRSATARVHFIMATYGTCPFNF